jgi:hypothetical protein
MTAQPQTCGQGLAEHAVLPERIAPMIDALADNLETHVQALDLTDPDARAERDAYERLASQHRGIAAQLEAVGAEMAGYEDLPMGRHDEAALTSVEAVDAFERFARAQTELLAVLGQMDARNREMLEQMRPAGGGGGS